MGSAPVFLIRLVALHPHSCVHPSLLPGVCGSQFLCLGRALLRDRLCPYYRAFRREPQVTNIPKSEERSTDPVFRLSASLPYITWFCVYEVLNLRVNLSIRSTVSSACSPICNLSAAALSQIPKGQLDEERRLTASRFPAELAGDMVIAEVA